MKVHWKRTSPHVSMKTQSSPPQTEQSQMQTKKPARRSKIKWPKSSETEAWRALDADLIKTLEESLHGGAETKLNLIGDIIYQTCKDRFGEIVPRQRTILREKGRREKEILQLVKSSKSVGNSEKTGERQLMQRKKG